MVTGSQNNLIGYHPTLAPFLCIEVHGSSFLLDLNLVYLVFCVSQLSVTDKMPEKISLKNERLILAHSFRTSGP